MTRPILILAAVLAAGLLMFCGTSRAQSRQQSLDAFQSIRLCAPLNTLITPGSGYSLRVDGEAAVVAAVTGSVSGGVLTLASGSFKTKGDIKINIVLPADALQSVEQAGQVSTAFIAAGFRGNSLRLKSSGTAGVYVDSAKYSSLKVTSSGTGSCAVAGTFDTADLKASGTSQIAVGTVKDSARVSGDGTSTITVAAASSRTKITGGVSGVSSVTYNQGQCSVRAGSPVFEPCTQDASTATPPVMPATEWTSNVEVKGRFDCGRTSGGSVQSADGSGSSNGGVTGQRQNGGSATNVIYRTGDANGVSSFQGP